MTAIDTYKDLVAQRQTLNQQIQAAAKLAFGEQAEDLFRRNSRLLAFSWTQYTPYFNDGDELIFNAYTDSPSLQMADEDDESEFFESHPFRQGEVKKPKATHPDPLTDEIIHQLDGEQARERAGGMVVEFLTGFDSAELRDMFGDHMKITVNRSGVDVSDYEHD